MLDRARVERARLPARSSSLHTYTGYYQHPRVLEALGLETRPPHPTGYPTIEGDLTLLDAVRGRARMYREC